jgi:hypothetical protein
MGIPKGFGPGFTKGLGLEVGKPRWYKILSLDKIRSWGIILGKLYVILQIGIPSLFHFLSASLFLSLLIPMILS